MKKNIITIFYVVIILISHNIYSQDIITKKDGTDIKTKVSEISDSEVKYKKYENLDGPTYSLLKSEILLIRYENGAKDVFTEKFIEQNTSNIKSKNAAYFELFGAGGAFSANYERIIFDFEKNRLSLRAGIGAVPFDGFWSLSFPISCNLITGSGNNHFEIGFGVTPDTYSDVFLNLIVGYRFQKPTNGLLFKANVNFMYEPFWGTYLPLPGFSIGYAF